MIAFTCPQCQQRLSVQDELAGTTVECPGCRMPVGVPLAVAAPPAGQVDFSLDDRKREVAGEITRSFDEAITRTFVNVGPSRALYDFLAPPQEADEIGRLGPFRVLRVLGAGGMGVVYRAEDPRLKRPVALKVMLPILAARESSRKRFVREAKAAAALDHDHIVPIFQVGEDRGVPFLAMQLLEGESLADRLRRRPALSVLEMLRIGRETALGLAAAHHQGLIHRDVKPANLWLEARPADHFRVKILDFGLARAVADDGHLTQSGAIVGTPGYMAPEQAAGETVDHRADLFSLGCVLYRLSTGSAPFKGKDAVATLVAVAAHDPKPPAEVCSHLPAAFSDLVIYLLAKKPDERPQSAQAVVAALQEIEEALSAWTRRGRPRRLLWVALATFVLAIGLAGLVVAWLRTDPNDGGAGADLAGAELAGAGPARAAVGEDPPIEGMAKVGEVRRFQGLGAQAISAALSMDGRLVLAGGEQGDRTVRLWDVQTGRELQRMPGHNRGIVSVGFFPDGRRGFSGSYDGDLCIWDLAEGKKLLQFRHEQVAGAGWLYSAALSPDGKVLGSAGVDDQLVRLWDTQTGKEVGRLEQKAIALVAAFSPDSRLIVAGGGFWDGKQPKENYALRLWDVATGKEVRRFDGHENAVLSVGFTRDGKHIVSGSNDGTARLWDVATGKEECRLAAGLSLFSGYVAASADGRRILTSWDNGAIRLWDSGTRQELKRFAGHGGRSRQVSFSAREKYALSASDDRTIRLWRLPD